MFKGCIIWIYTYYNEELNDGIWNSNVGRPRFQINMEEGGEMRRMDLSITKISEIIGVSRSTLYRVWIKFNLTDSQEMSHVNIHDTPPRLINMKYIGDIDLEHVQQRLHLQKSPFSQPPHRDHINIDMTLITRFTNTRHSSSSSNIDQYVGL